MRTKQKPTEIDQFTRNLISVTGKSNFRGKFSDLKKDLLHRMYLGKVQILSIFFFSDMAVKGKKVQKQQQKPVPKLVKPAKEEEEEELEEDDDVEDEELEEKSDEDVGEKEEDEEDDEELEEEDDKDEEEDEDDDAEEKVEEVEKKEAAKDSDEDESMQTTIFVGHINYQLTQKELNDFFGKAGEIESSRIIPKRGYAFVTYKEGAAVVEALKLDKAVLSGKPVHVERVKSKRSDNQKRQEMKRKHNKDQNDTGSKKAKVDDKTVKPRKYSPANKANRGGKGAAEKGRPKTAQKPHTNKKQDKAASGKFVKPTA